LVILKERHFITKTRNMERAAQALAPREHEFLFISFSCFRTFELSWLIFSCCQRMGLGLKSCFYGFHMGIKAFKFGQTHHVGSLFLEGFL